MIKQTFNLIRLSLKILVIYRHSGCQRPTHRHSVIGKMRLKLSAIYLLTRDTHNLIHSGGLEWESVHTPPVIILCQGHLLKVNVKSVAFGGLKDPVTSQIVAVVARETGGDNATIGGVFYHPSTGCYSGGKKRWREDRSKVKARKGEVCKIQGPQL